MRKITCFFLLLFAAMLSDSVTVVAEEPELYAQSAVLMDGDTGRILFGKNEKEVRPMASTTKIMTCILILENVNLEDTAEVSQRAAAQPKVHLGAQAGQKFYVRDILYSLMLESHNDAAVILAEKAAGSVEAFAAMMNEKAKELGCQNTHFVTPNGLDEEDEGGAHSTTAEELGRILCYCIAQSPRREEFLEITRTPSHSFTDVAGSRSYSCTNHNAFLGMMEGALTGKTGFTGKAGYCYVGALQSEGRTFVVALLGCGWPNNRSYKWKDTRKLMTYAMERYHYRTVELDRDTGQIPVENGIPDSLRLEDACFVPTHVDAGDTDKIEVLVSPEDKLEVRCSIARKLAAPVARGTSVGYVRALLNGEEIACRPVVTEKDIGKVTYPWCARRIWERFLGV